MSLPAQFACFVILLAIGGWLIFYKAFLRFGRKAKRHIQKIKEEIGRDEE